eukprot:366432-Chlamydomonas_euryale.AAC.3
MRDKAIPNTLEGRPSLYHTSRAWPRLLFSGSNCPAYYPPALCRMPGFDRPASLTSVALPIHPHALHRPSDIGCPAGLTLVATP